jgi:hypothetical protein
MRDSGYKPRVLIPRSTRTLLCALLAAAALTAGCKSLSRISACSELTDVINGELSVIAELYSKDEVAPEDYAQMRQTYRALEARLAGLSLDAYPDLKQAVTAYRGALRNTAVECQRYENDLRKHLTASENDDRQASMNAQRMLSSIRRRMTKTMATYDAAAKRIERSCTIR